MTIDAAFSRVRQPPPRSSFRRLLGQSHELPIEAKRQFVWGFRCCLWARRRRQRSAAATGGAKRSSSAHIARLAPFSAASLWALRGKQGPTPRSKLKRSHCRNRQCSKCVEFPSVVRFSPSHEGSWTRLPFTRRQICPTGVGRSEEGEQECRPPGRNDRDERRMQWALVPVVDQGEVPPTLV